jgi:hypothetical protein
MTLYHTSPTAITEPKTGLFGDFLCFSQSVYVMTAAADPITYQIDIDDDEAIDASAIWYHQNAEKAAVFADQVADRFHVDRETAESLIDGSLSIYTLEDIDIEPEDMAEVDWEIQRITAEAGRALGFTATLINDEQGSCYMIPAATAINRWQMANAI